MEITWSSYFLSLRNLCLATCLLCKIPAHGSWSYQVVSLHCPSRCSWHLCCVLRSGTRWSGIGARVGTTVTVNQCCLLMLWKAYYSCFHVQKVSYMCWLHVPCCLLLMQGASYDHIFRSLTGAGIFITTVVIGTVIVVSKARPFNIGEWQGALHTPVILLGSHLVWYIHITLSMHCLW